MDKHLKSNRQNVEKGRQHRSTYLFSYLKVLYVTNSYPHTLFYPKLPPRRCVEPAEQNICETLLESAQQCTNLSVRRLGA